MLDWQSHKKLRIFIRTICIVLIVTFFSYDLTWAGAGEVFSLKNRRASQESPAVDIPQELGVIKESYTSKYNPHKLVIHIQDAHANVEAQANEANLVKYLKDKYKVNLVSVEGGFGDFDADFFRSFPKDKKVRERIAKYFLSKSFISGTDYLLMTENEPPKVFGAEDKELYTIHLNIFKENQSFSDSLGRSLKAVEDVIDTLKNKYYSKDLREFTDRMEDFRLGRLPLEEYISYLNIASIIHNADLSKFPNLSRIINLQELEHKIDFSKAESERQDLIDSLTKALSKQDLEELVKRSLDFKANKLTPLEYYSYLEKLAQGLGINPVVYNNLFTYIKYISVSENLDNSKVFEEIDTFAEVVKDKLTATLAQRDIEQLSSIVRILKGLSGINLSPKDYEYFKGNREVFNSKAIAILLRRYTNTSALNSLPGDNEIASLEKFYSLAHDRDNAIVSNSLNRLNRDYSSNSVIIVAGGFHTAGLTSILKEKDISYVVIAPSIKQSQEKENTYFALLKDKKLPLQDILNEPDTLQIINSISDPEARQLLVNYWVARASRYYSVKELQAQLSSLTLSGEDQKAVESALNEISVKAPEGTSQETSLAQESSFKTPPATVQISGILRANSNKFIALMLQKVRKSIIIALIFWSSVFSSFSGTAASTGISATKATSNLGAPAAETIVPNKGSYKYLDYLRQQRNALKEQKKKVDIAYFANLSRRDSILGEKGAERLLRREVSPALINRINELHQQRDALGNQINNLQKQIKSWHPITPLPAQITATVSPEAAPGITIKPSAITSDLLTSPDAQMQKAAQEKIANLLTQQEQVHQEALKKIQDEQQKTQAQLTLVQVEQFKIQGQLVKAQDDLVKEGQQALASQQAIEKLNNQQQQAESKVTAQEEKNKALEIDLSNIKKRLDKTEQRISEAEKKLTDFKSYEKSWWQGLARGWKAALYLLSAFGIGIASLRLFLYRRWSKLKTLKEEINNKHQEQAELEKVLSVKRDEFDTLAKQAEAVKLYLAEADKQRVSQEETIQKAILEVRRLQEESEKLRKANNLDTLTQERDRFTQTIEGIEKQIIVKKDELLVLIVQEETKVLTLKSQVIQLEGEQAKYETAVQNLKKKADQYESEVRTLEQQKGKAKQELAVLGDVSIAQAQIEEVNKRIQEAEETLRRLNSEVSSLGTQKNYLEAELTRYRADKAKLETEIDALTQEQQKFTREVSGLQAQKDSFIQKEVQLRASIEVKAAELKGVEEKIAFLQAQNQESAPQTASLKAKKESLEKEIAKLSQYIADLSRETAAKKISLDKDIRRKQALLDELALKALQLNGQKAQLEQEISALSTQKQKETQGLDTAKKESEAIVQEILIAQQQIGQANTEIENLLVHIEELKQRGVNLNEEVPALTSRRDVLQEELQGLEKTRQQIQENISQARKDNPPQAPQASAVILPRPYAAMVFDVDNTLTDITTKIDKNLLELILGLLAQNVRIALVTVQSIDEVKEYIVKQVPEEQKNLLLNLTIYPSAGAKRFSFDAQGNPFNDEEYDATVGLTLAVNPQEIKAAIQQVVGVNARVGLRDGAITITGLSNREEAMGKLPTLFKEEGWHLVPRIAGGHSIHVLIGGVDKAKAATHFIKEYSAKAFNQEVPLQNVLVIGDSFYAGGLDADLASVLEGADIVSVGRKPRGNQLRDLKAKGLFFSEDLVGIRNWQATFKILKEVTRGKTVREIRGKDVGGSSFSGPASMLLALSTAVFSLFPSTISNAQMSLPGAPAYRSVQASNETAQLTVFTAENYKGNIGIIDRAIKIIGDAKIKDPGALNGLKWAAVTATLPDNRYYPDTTTSAVLALLETDEGAKILAEAINDRVFIGNETRFMNVLKAVGERKTRSPEIFESLKWITLQATFGPGRNGYYPFAVKLATKTLIHLGQDGMRVITESLNVENYRDSRIKAEVFEAIAEAGVRNANLMQKMYWVVLEASYRREGDNLEIYYLAPGDAAAKALYQLEGRGAIVKFKGALTNVDIRTSAGAGRAIIVIAKTQGASLSPEVIDALREVQKLDASSDQIKFENKQNAESILSQLPPAKVAFFTPERYRDYPQEIILDAKTSVFYPDSNFVDERARAIVYVDPSSSFNQDILKACLENLLKLGDKGKSALAFVFTSANYQKSPNNLKAALQLIVPSENINPLFDSNLIDSLVSLASEPNLAGGNYNYALNKEAIQAVIRLGGADALNKLFTAENYRTKPAQLALVIDSIAEVKTTGGELTGKLLWAFEHKNADGSRSGSLRASLLNAFLRNPGLLEAGIPFPTNLGDTDDEISGRIVAALINLKISPEDIAPFVNSNNPLVKKSAQEVLKAIVPGSPTKLAKPKIPAASIAPKPATQAGASGVHQKTVLTLSHPVSAATLRRELFFYENYHDTAQALRDYYQDKPWTERIPNYLLSYIADAQIWVLVGLGLVGFITGIVFYVRGQKVRAVYKQLTSYVGQTTWQERRRLKKAAVQVAKKTNYDVDDVYKAIAEKLPEVSEITRNKRIDKIAKFLDKLNQAKVNSGQVLRYGVPFMAQAAKDENEFDKGLDILADTAKELKKNNISVDTIFGFSLNSINGYVTEFSIFEAACKFIMELSSRKQNPQEILNAVVPQALKTAKDANIKVARLNIILHLLLESIHPTQLLIETLEKTTSQSNFTAQLTQWSRLMNDFKTGAVKFDINNPVYVDLEYTTYRQLASQLSQSNTYENYQSLIQQFRSQSGSPSGLAAQEQAEVKLAVYEAYRLLEFIVAVKSKADKIARSVWVIPNLSYGKFAVSPILDELGKLNIEVHYAKVGSTGAHEHPEYVVPALFTDDVYLRILRERPILLVVDGTQHLMPRPEEGKSSRYPDAYVGYRNMVVALNEIISEKKEDKFLDKVHISKDFFGTLHQNPEYTSLVDTLEKLNAGLDQPMLFYKLGFWNPAGLPLVVREARKEVQKVTPLNPDDLDSPTLIFINSPLLDEDLPADIKQWAGLEQPHVPAYFDDKGQIQQTMFAVNGRGVYLSHSMEFETNRACQEIKDNYKGRLPQIVYQQPTPESVRSAYEAMLFDLDGTLTDTLSEIDKSLLNKLIYFLSSGVVIGIVTSQSLDEVKKYILDKVDSNNSAALKSLVVFTARGAQAWGFDQNKNPYSIYDRSQTDLNDQQRNLIRQLVNQALGSLSGDTDVTDRQGQITIRLKKNKDKRDLVNTTLTQLISNNNLPFQTEYSGNSTIHVVMRGIDKGTAKDYFISQLLPQRLNHQTDVSKLLIAGDRFQDGGSDRPMIVPGARVVSVGGKDKTVPAGVEVYPHHGWKGTNQLLGDIINKSGRTTVTLPSLIIGLFGLPDFWQGLNDVGQGLYDVSKKPLLYFGIATLGLGFLFLSITSGIKYYKSYRLYKEIKQALSFLDAKDSRRLFKAISGYTTWKKIQHIDPYDLLVNILPVLSKQTQDKRLIETANLAVRLKKSKINLSYVFKYILEPISSKASDEKQFITSLGIAERFVLSFKDKRFDYHDFLREIMPSLAKTTRSIDELNEAMLLGITLVRSGRNPTFALTRMLPEVAALTKSFSDFRLGVYALQQLCLEGFEPTKYLIHELIKQGQPQKIDQSISDWQEIRRKFKTGEVAFNPKNQLHANLEYTTFRELVDRTLKQTRKYSFTEYQQILGNFNNNHNQPHLRRTEKAEIKFAAYEAFRFRQFVLDVKRQADKMSKKVWVVPNLSYGRFAVSPIIKDLAADGVEVHYARIGSTESHDNALLVKPDLFGAALYDRMMNEQPVIIVVDGTQHLLARPKDRKSGRYPDAYVGYRNLIIAINDILTQGQEQFFKHLVKTDGSLIRHLRKKSDYRTMRRRLLRLYNPNIKTKRSLYAVEFWNPGGLELALRRDRKEVTRVRNVSPNQINQPTLIFVNSVMLDEDVPVFIRDWINRDKKVHHKPAYFDDTSHIQNIIFNVDTSGVSLSDEIYTNIRKEYKRIKGIYRPSFNLPAKPLNLPKLPYKAVISDLDGTLSDTLQETPKPVMEKLFYLLSLGVQVAIVTTQSYKEVEKYLLSQVPAKYKALLSNLSIYAATGSQGFGFDKNGDPLKEPLYDISDVKLSDRQMDAWRGIIQAMLKEYALDKEVKDKKGNLIATPVKIIDAGSQVIIRLKERGFLRREIVKRLQSALNREQLPITLKEIGGTSIRMTIKGIDKSIAVDYHLTQVCKSRFGFAPKPQEVLILGNSFDEDGDDRDMMIRGAKVFAVGHKPLLHHLRAGIDFYPEHGWEGSDQVLAEFINAMSAKVEEAKKQMPKPASTTLNSFAFLPFLAAGGLFDNLDSFTSFVFGCIVGIVATLLIFKNRIFGSKEEAESQDYYDEQEPQQNTPAFDRRKPVINQARTQGFDTSWQVPPLRRKQTDFNQTAKQIREDYPGIKVGIIGATAPTKGYASQTGEELGRKLRTYIGENGFVFTGGVSGVGVDVYQGVVNASNGQEDRFFVLLPEGMSAGWDYRDILPNKQVKTANFGEDMFERRIGMGKVADVIIVLNGRAGTLHEAVSALESGKKIIALNNGGAGSLLYQAKVNGIVPVLLSREGVKQEHLENIIASDIESIEQALSDITGVARFKEETTALQVIAEKESEIKQSEVIQPSFDLSNTGRDNPMLLDSFGKYIFTANKDGEIALSAQAVSAINSLSEAHSGMTLEIDIDTLIDTSKGTPQLKGLGFREALASLYQAQEKKQISEGLRIRLININPSLDKNKIVKVLGLSDELLNSMVSVPKIPEDYLVKSLEPYLVEGSIRVIFEDNAKYWGKKVDVLVKRGKETETLSSLGLIVAGLAKEPKFYDQLPKELKEYIVAKTDRNGKVELDDEGKIKQLIFKPIEKTKVDTQYLDKLDKANKKLEGMV